MNSRFIHNNTRTGFLIINCFLLIVNCFSLDFNFRPKGFVSIPMGEGNRAPDGKGRYSLGGGGELGFEIDLSTVWPNRLGLGYTFGLEGALLMNPLQGDTPSNTSFYSIGGALGLYYFPLSRLFTRLDGSVGVSVSARESGRSDPGLFLRGGGEIGFRFTPAFTVAANAGWRHFYTGKTALNSGMYAGLTAQITLRTGSANLREGVQAALDQSEPVYPAFMQLYQSNPIGTVTLRNNENAEIRDVRLYFRASGYTASEFPCGSVGIIPRGRSAELPLLADFSPDILRFTDTGRIMGELVIRYRFLGQEREVVRAVTVATNNRNTVPLTDAAQFAAFISPTSTETLDFARFIAGLDRAGRRTGHNSNMQYAIRLLEGLRASGIMLGETYADKTETQFPAETLSYRTGNERDLALLFAAALEGVGITSAFIQTENGFLTAFSLGIGQSAAETLFSDFEKILVIYDEVWLPLSMGAFNEGFIASWTQGAQILTQTFAEGRLADFIVVQDAWTYYPPAPLPQLGRNVLRTEIELVEREFDRAMEQYIQQEITPLLQRQLAMGNEQLTMNNGAGFNRLGILYARAGRISEAKPAYERAAGIGSVAAMTNRGNLALIEEDFTTAQRWFRQALERQPENAAARRGMEQISEQ